MGDDLNQWVCKYNDLNKLFNELLASEFAKLWHINIPECALVEIDYDRHIVPIFVKECKDRLPYILAQLPKKWCIDVDNYQNKINDIFLDNWLRICEQLFRTYIQTFIICKP